MSERDEACRCLCGNDHKHCPCECESNDCHGDVCESCEGDLDGDLGPFMRSGWALCEDCAEREGSLAMWSELEARELSGFYDEGREAS